MLTLPGDTKIIETPLLCMGFDKDHILNIIYKQTPVRTLEETKRTIEEVKKLVGGRKVCILADVTYIGETNCEIRRCTGEEAPKIAKAIAIVSDSALGKMMANLFFTLRPQPFPVKVFNDQTIAKEWLKKYLN